jgi:hypothetical protein
MTKTVQRPKSKAQSGMLVSGGWWLVAILTEMTQRDTKGQKRTERDNIFGVFFRGMSLISAGCIATGMTEITLKHTKTHKCTTFPQLFFPVPVSSRMSVSQGESDSIRPNPILETHGRDARATTEAEGENKDCVKMHPFASQATTSSCLFSISHQYADD